MWRILLVCSFVFVATSACAGEEGTGAPQALENALQRVAPGLEPDQVRQTPVSGLYEVTFGARVLYFSADGRYVIRGEMIDLLDGRNLTENQRNGARLAAIGSLDEDQMIIYSPDGGPKHTVTVFTDIDCGYCRRLHRQIDDYLERGIRVRYVFYPRSGPGSSSFRKAKSVWCADDRQQALTEAKKGRPVPARQCDNPVREHYELGQAVGVRGTPYIVAGDGRAFAGLVPPNRLERVLEASGDVAGTMPRGQ